MKIVIILVLLSTALLQTSATFFHHSPYSFAKVKHMGGLLTNAVTDTRNTIDCTVSALENLLSQHGLYDAKFRTECGSGSSGQRFPRETTTYTTVTRPFGQISQDIGKRTENWREELSDGIKSSISRINESLLNELIDRDATAKIEYDRDEMRNEANRLLQVSLLLRKELDELAAKGGYHKSDINFDPYHASVSDVMKELQVLHDHEKNVDLSRAREVRNVYNKVLDVFNYQGNPSSKLSSVETYAEIVKDLEHEKLVLKAKSPSSNKNLSHEKYAENKEIQNKNFPSSFKDLFNSKSGETPSSTPSIESLTKDEEGDLNTSDQNALLKHYFAPKSKEEHEKTVKEALDLFEQGEMSRSLMDDVFSDLDMQANAQSVFDNPDLLNSG